MDDNESNLMLMNYLLICLEQELRRLSWWERERPDEKALNSLTPFCADSLSLSQWLQWVFIPKTQRYMEDYAALPSKCGILPMAEMAWRSVAEAEIEALMRVIARIDHLIECRHLDDVFIIFEDDSRLN